MYEQIVEIKAARADPLFAEPAEQQAVRAAHRVCEMRLRAAITRLKNKGPQIGTLARWAKPKWAAHRLNDQRLSEELGVASYNDRIDALKGMAKALHGTALES